MAKRPPPAPVGLSGIRRRLHALGDAKAAHFLRGYFKTGPGEYGEGDRFIGVKVPLMRKLAGECGGAAEADTLQLLVSPVHEERVVALMILVRRFEKGDDAERARIYNLYLANTRFINNWDLVDGSAPQIVGGWLAGRAWRRTLEGLARSSSLWERRIAILATYHFIRRGEFEPTLHVARMLLADREDLIHKAVGWMLREVGERDLPALEQFLGEHLPVMPRTTLRYAIERFPEPKRTRYLLTPSAIALKGRRPSPKIAAQSRGRGDGPRRKC
jgi:3-methyladenine DNA glycosylase AlkD